MRTRALIEDDMPKLRALYDEQGWKYDFPDFMADDFVVRLVIVDDEGNLVNAVCARKTVELYMLADKNWRSPRWRLEAVKQMHSAMNLALVAQGYTDAHCWLPPEIGRSFGRRLTRMFQWVKNTWPCYSHEAR